jgi:biopolymer transport protein ExbD
MRLPTHHDERRQRDIAMTPMIDVVFLLMIFFICTASYQLAEELLPTSLAVASGSSRPAPVEAEPELERLIVRATRANGMTEWLVNERPCDTLLEVRQVLRAAAEIDRSLPVILDVADDVPLGDMIDVYDLCRLEGFKKIQFAAERKELKPQRTQSTQRATTNGL